MTLRTAVTQGTELLKTSGTPEPRLTAEILLCHAVRCERPYLYAHDDQELREVEWIHYGRWLHERMQGKPLQYITNVQEFYGRPFRVTPDVLIPRPETELLVETVLKRRPGARRIVDVGTGSGAIAVTLALETQASVIATDISPKALTSAATNARQLRADLSFFRGDLVSFLRQNAFDVLVANPPYVSLDSRNSLQWEVRNWEPELALFAGPDGLDVYRRLIPEAWRVLEPGGLLALEIGFGQAEDVAALLRDWRDLNMASDLAGIPRVISCEKPA